MKIKYIRRMINENNKLELVFEVENKLQSEELVKEKMYEIKEYREKRSLNANAYAWKLMGELAKKLNTSNNEIYEKMLVDYGTNLLNENDKPIIISTETELKSTSSLHIAYIGSSQAKDKVFNHYRIIKGSSEYSTKEMSIFIDGIVSEAKEQGIETLDDIKLKNMCDRWVVK